MKPIHLCIGAPRAGTTWLFRELKLHSSVFLPIVKEVRYWNGRRSDSESKITAENAFRRISESNDAPIQIEWINRWQKVRRDDPPSIEEYIELMSVPGRSTVDISPTYCFMPRRLIKELKNGLPEGSKIIYLVRQPLDRLASQLKLHYFLHGCYRGIPSHEDISGFLADKGQQMRWDYAGVINNWREVFGEDFIVLPYNKVLHPKKFISYLSEILEFDLEPGTESREEESFFHSDQNQNKQTLLPSLGRNERILLARSLKSDLDNMEEVLPVQVKNWRLELDKLIDEPMVEKKIITDVDIEVQKLMRMTESLGDNCEYGFWQRHRGYEPSSLFRWAIIPVKELIEFLKNPDELYHRNKLIPHSPGMVRDQTFGMAFHSQLVEKDQEGSLHLKHGEVFDELYQSEKEKINYLHKKFFFYLKKKPGLYIIKKNAGLDFENVEELASLLCKANPMHLLLWVESGVTESTTEIKTIGDRIIMGRVPEFAKYTSADIYHSSGWTTLMRQVANEPKVRVLMDRMFR